MTLTLDIPPELGAKLQEAASSRGVTAEEHAIHMLGQNLKLTPNERAADLAALFASYSEDEDDGDVSWDEIYRRMDESRGEGRKLFPPELKGTTWE